jgi:hypothetical protein
MVGAAGSVVFAAERDVVDGAVYGEVDGEFGVGAVVLFEVFICEFLRSILIPSIH